MNDPMRAEARPAEIIALEVLVNGAVETHGADVVAWAWTNLFAAFLPVAGAMVAEQRMFEAAKKNGLSGDDVEQAIVLLASLRAPPSDHNAWVASDVIRKYAKDPERLLIALQSKTGKESH